MGFIVFFLVAIIGYLLYVRNGQIKYTKSMAAAFDCAWFAGATKSGSTAYIQEFSHWLEELPSDSREAFVASLYKSYGLDQPSGSIMSIELMNKIIHELHIHTKSRRVQIAAENRKEENLEG